MLELCLFPEFGDTQITIFVFRERLSRACKEDRLNVEQVNCGNVPKYAKIEGRGCLKLEHLEANNLQAIDWNASNRLPSYRFDCFRIGRFIHYLFG